jgi:hypothetical protein
LIGEAQLKMRDTATTSASAISGTAASNQDKAKLREHSNAIQTLHRDMIANMIQPGRRLIEIKELLLNDETYPYIPSPRLTTISPYVGRI